LNILKEDEILMDEFQNLGLQTKRVDWEDRSVNWAATKCILFRTPWNYYNKYTKFSEWLNSLPESHHLINNRILVDWSLDKKYLFELENKGIQIPNSLLLHKKSNLQLIDLLFESKWERAILKPCISAAARHTYLLDQSNIQDHQSLFEELNENEEFLFQEFQENIIEKGEVSLMLMDGKFTHAVIKNGKEGDFRVQDGGTVALYSTNEEEIAFAENVMSTFDDMPLYARVDVMWDNKNRLVLSELELIEPELWFRLYPLSAKVLAESIYSKYFKK
jgi:hypothetical protein